MINSITVASLLFLLHICSFGVKQITEEQYIIGYVSGFYNTFDPEITVHYKIQTKIPTLTLNVLLGTKEFNSIYLL